MSDRLQALYQEVVLDHNKNPRNFGELEAANCYSHGLNPLCGDDFHLFLQLDDNDVIQDLKFKGEGCAVSKASASLMTLLVKNKTLEEALELRGLFHRLVTEESLSPEDEKLLGSSRIFAGVKNYPVRVKCATLIWHALEDALKDRRSQGEKESTKVSTE